MMFLIFFKRCPDLTSVWVWSLVKVWKKGETRRFPAVVMNNNPSRPSVWCHPPTGKSLLALFSLHIGFLKCFLLRWQQTVCLCLYRAVRRNCACSHVTSGQAQFESMNLIHLFAQSSRAAAFVRNAPVSSLERMTSASSNCAWQFNPNLAAIIL